ncbi:MAG TPA: hypothetical protein ENG51_15480 [Deltaproteobacteria bacterium]|nr:MAG: hypothetical protein DRG59_11230 [Deltaproteobacteria bacterium]RLB05315.1 MAG: hypothetical protein DRG83_02910 [Deltaproteobacteria bacterium]HDM77844.1 hypothetical protein [Deltaproteobacteria bacterium]
MKFEDISVQCYSGYRANESPRCLRWKGKEYKIIRIIDRWYEGGIKSTSDIMDYFKVELDDGSVRILRYNRLFGGWGMLIED